MSTSVIKKCKDCAETKPQSEFAKGNQCILCKRKYNREYNRKKREKIRLEKEEAARNAPEPEPVTSKFCSKCKQNKDISEFRSYFRKERNKIQIRSNCKDCERAHGRAYRQSESGKQKSKEWIEQNRERFSELQHNNYEKNKAKIRETYNNRYHSDEDFKREKGYRSAVQRIASGKQKTTKYMSCTNKRFLDWLEFNFEDGMSHNNYASKWNVDHVIPLNERRDDDAYQFDIISKWYNITPVNPSYNLTKNKHRDLDQASSHLERYELYCSIRKLKIDTKYTHLLNKYISNHVK